MPPVVIAAGIGAAAGIGGGLLSASAQKKAAGKMADSAANTASQNNALQREIYGQNSAMLSPYVQRGNEAGNAINSLLGITGTAPPATTPGYGGGIGGVAGPSNALSASYFAANPDVASEYGRVAGQFTSPDDYANFHYQTYGQNEGRAAPGSRTPAGAAFNPGVDSVPTGTVQATPQTAFQNYLGSTGYQFQMDQGNKAINQGYAARGSLQSGAAMKALQTYGQNTATGFFKDYLGLLSNQQSVGLTGASAVAGVGQNYANTVSANNNNASAAAQGAYADRANAMTGLYGNIAGGIAGVANAYGSSYRR